MKSLLNPDEQLVSRRRMTDLAGACSLQGAANEIHTVEVTQLVDDRSQRVN